MAVDGGDGGGGKAAMIGDKHHAALLFLVPDFDATQKQIVVPSAGRFKKEDDLVAPNRTVFGNWTAFDDAVIGVSMPGPVVPEVPIRSAGPSPEIASRLDL
jgi:hypothetical protein